MIYLIETSSLQLRNKFIDNILEKNQINYQNKYIYNFENKNNDLLNAYSQFVSNDIFDNKKIIIIYEASFLKNKTLYNKYLNYLNDIIISKSNNVIVFCVDSLRQNDTYLSSFIKQANILKKDVPKGKELEKFVNNFLEKRSLSIDNQTILNFLNKTNEDFEIIVNELKKMSLLQNKKIISSTIDDVVFDYKNESYFNIINMFFNKDKNNFLNHIFLLVKKGYSYVSIFEFLLNELLLIKNINFLLNNNLEKLQKLKTESNINNFRYSKLLQYAKKFNEQEITNLLNIIIEINLKSKKIDPSIIKTWIQGKFELLFI